VRAFCLKIMQQPRKLLIWMHYLEPSLWHDGVLQYSAALAHDLIYGVHVADLLDVRNIGRHWYLPAKWRSFIRWTPDQWVSQCYAIECDKSFYCALLCVFMTRVSQCPISLRAEQPIYMCVCAIQSSIEFRRLFVDAPLSSFFQVN
jgi:hypothetical protein